MPTARIQRASSISSTARLNLSPGSADSRPICASATTRGRAVGLRRYAPMFPAFLDMQVDEMHVEMASREFAELETIGPIAAKMDVAVGIIDVKSYYIETVEDIAARVEACLEYAPADRLSFAPDCGLSQTARWGSETEAGEHGGWSARRAGEAVRGLPTRRKK